MKKLILTAAIVALVSIIGQAQNTYDADYESHDTANYPYWIEMMQNPDANVFETVKAFDKYWENRPDRKGSGYNPFKRWEWYMMHKMKPDGSRLAEDYDLKAYNQYVNLRSENEFNGDWENLGPIQLPSSPNPFWGNGRVNALAFHPSDVDIFYVGAPSGGLWKTEDGGASWEPLSDGQPTLGVSSIVVNYDDPDIILVGSGDRDAGDADGLGVYKSTDGGSSWDDTHNGMGNVTVGRMIQHPDDPDIIFASTSGGIYKSIDLGESWTQKQSGSSKDILFKPDDPTIMYAVFGAKFYYSDDSGETWLRITTGLPGGASRAVIGVSPDEPDYVYLFATGSSAFYGLYRSTDAGQTFETRSTTPNIMGWSCNGGSGGQAWYDLDMAVDPLDGETIYGGGINCWKSTNGGQNWVMSSNQVGDCSAYPVHADLHVLEYNPLDGKLFVGNDGGVWWTDNGGVVWNRITDGLAIGQQYKLGQSKLTSNHVTTGYQDNGISTYHTDTWIQSDMYADGMESAMDNFDTTLGYGCAQYGRMYRRKNDKATNLIAGQNVGGINESGNWISPFCQSESNPNVMFAGYQSLWRTTNLLDTYPSWTNILSGSGSVTVVEHSPADENLFYFASSSSGFYRSDNVMFASPAATALSGRLPSSGNVRDIEAHPSNPDIVYIVQNMGVFKSVDKGQNWEDISGSLPEVSLNDIAYYDRAGLEGLYVASNIGVFFKDETMSDWIYYSEGLPAAILATEVEIFQHLEDPALDRIRISSYGRGLWSSVPYYADLEADFESSETKVPTGCQVDFFDRSAGYAQSWSWNFEGGEPSTSIEANPIGIIYDQDGIYEVSLTVSNPAGTDSKTVTDYITVDSEMLPIVDFMAYDTVFCANGVVEFIDLSEACPIGWEWTFEPNMVTFLEGTNKYSQNPKVEFTENGTYSVTLKATNTAGVSELTKEDYISIGGLFLPFYEDFQGGQSLSALGWEILNPDGSKTWEMTDIDGGDNQVAWVNIFDYPTLISRDYLITPLLNFQGYSEVYLTFKYAYAQKYFQKDSLIVSVSGDCGATWKRVFANGPDGEGVFETAEPTNDFFEPKSTDDWCGVGYGADCPVIDLSEWADQTNIKVRFESYANYGNNLYLTNIDISSTVGMSDMVDVNSGSFIFYPNPTTGELNVTKFSEGEAQVQILDIQGRLVRTDKMHGKQLKINVNDLTEGVYFIRFSNQSVTKTRKLIIH